MDLKTFIKETITQMADAIDEINKNSDGLIVVNPSSIVENDNNVAYKGGTHRKTIIHYNVALTISDEGTAEGKLGVLTGLFGGSASTGSKNQSQALTSLDFQLDVLLPQG